MRRGMTVRFVAMLAQVLVPAVVWSQTVGVGAIAGVARDPSGAMLPGVTVEAASPALIEKVRSVATDDSGQYKVVDLRPGTYTVTFTLSGFATLKREGLEVVSGVTVPVNAEMKVGDLQETITVSGATPVVDTQNVRIQAVVSGDVQNAIPGARNFSGLAKLTVGATGGTNDLGGNNGEGSVGTIHGTGAGTTTVDGQRVMSVFSAGTGLRLSINQLTTQEIVLETSGTFAESESGGLNVNVVSKDGGNTLSFVSADEYSTKALQGSNLDDALRARGVTTNPKLRTLYDVGAAVGGPVLRDRLWFFASGRSWGTQSDVAGLYFNKRQGSLYYEPDLDRAAYTDLWNRAASGRLTWQATAKQKTSLNVSTSNICNCYFDQGFTAIHPVGSNAAPEAAYERRFWPNYIVQGTWNMPVSGRLLLEAGVTSKTEVAIKNPVPEAQGARSVVELGSNFEYGSNFVGPLAAVGGTWLDDYGDHGNSGSIDVRFAASYVSGSHAFKTGFTAVSADSPSGGAPLFNEQYHFRNVGGPVGTCIAPFCTPVALAQLAAPNFSESRLKVNLGIYVQDQWTIKKLTLNLGVRLDHLNAYNPAQTRPGGVYLPELSFAEVKNLPNWYDINPRMGVAYDVFGDGKTAIKASWGRYVVLESTTIASLNSPANALGVYTTRTWTDSNSNLVPDCVLTNPLLNGECGPYSNRNFGTPVVTTHYADAVTKGFSARPYNWQGSLGIQQELRPGVGLTVSYFRTWYGNLSVTDNLAVTPADFDPYCITTPIDPLLPGGGGQPLCGLANVSNAKFGLADNLVRPASDFGKSTQTYNGVDAVVNGRFGKGWICHRRHEHRTNRH